MELQVQKYLKENGLQSLIDNFKIETTEHPTLPLTIFSYSQIECCKNHNLKYHPICCECRSLVLEYSSWNLVSRAFNRFFNYEENPPTPFNWDHYWVQEKVDGSIISLFYYGEAWHIRTNASFAEGKICVEFEWTWKSLFHSILSLEKIEQAKLNPNVTYVFELTSPYNIVVVSHKEPNLTLLSAFDVSHHGDECGLDYCNWVAEKLGVNRPKYFNFSGPEEIRQHVNKKSGLEFEGFVLIDKDYNRLKIKGEDYLRKHRLKGNGNIILYRNLVPCVMEKPEEKDEIIAIMPAVKGKWDEVEQFVEKTFKDADEIYKLYPDYNQKQFALAIKSESYYLKSILFTARKCGKLPSSIKNEFVDLIVKVLEEN